MKKIKQTLLFSFVILLLATPSWSNIKKTEHLSKTIRKQYKVSQGVSLEISNKYGEIIFNTWEKDSIKIVIHILAHGKSKDAAEKLMKRADFEFAQVDGKVTVHTVFDKSKGFFKDLWNDISDYSKSILNKDQLDINFEVYVPSYTNINLTNKFGDVFLDEVNGKVDATISNGSFKAGHLSASTNLNLSFGDADIKSMINGKITLKSVDLNLGSSQQLNLQSHSSNISIKKAKKIILNSRTDKIKIDSLDVLSGRGSFSKIIILSLHKNIKLETSYGSLKIYKLKKTVTKVNLKGKATDIHLSFSNSMYLKTNVIAKEGRFNFPKAYSLKQTYTDRREKFIRTSGFIGKPKYYPASVNIEAQGGDVVMKFSKQNK